MYYLCYARLILLFFQELQDIFAQIVGGQSGSQGGSVQNGGQSGSQTGGNQNGALTTLPVPLPTTTITPITTATLTPQQPRPTTIPPFIATQNPATFVTPAALPARPITISQVSGQFGSQNSVLANQLTGHPSGQSSGQFGSQSLGFGSQRPGQLGGQISGQFGGQPLGLFGGQNPGQFGGQNSGQFGVQNPGHFGGNNPGQFGGQPLGQLGNQGQGQFVSQSFGQSSGRPSGQFNSQLPGLPANQNPGSQFLEVTGSQFAGNGGQFASLQFPGVQLSGLSPGNQFAGQITPPSGSGFGSSFSSLNTQGGGGGGCDTFCRSPTTRKFVCCRKRR